MDSKPEQWRKAPKQALLTAMRLCLRNAASLHRAGSILQRAGSHNAAFVLGTLALEEAGKVVYLTILSHSDREHLSEEYAKALHRRFFDHSTKGQLALNSAWKSVLYVRRRKHVPYAKAEAAHRRLIRAYQSVYEYLEETPGADDIAEMKLLALYVGTKENILAEPPTVPGPVSKGLIAIVSSAIRDARRLRDAFRRSSTDGLAESIIAVMFKREMMQDTLQRLQNAGAEPPVTAPRGKAEEFYI